MPSLGTVQTKYGKDWIYVNPFPFTGPNSWNVSSTVFDDAFGQLYGVPPMVTDKVEDDFFMSYSIEACKSLDGDTSQFIVSDAPEIFSDTVAGVDSFEGLPPVFTNKVDKVTVYYFNISRLNSIDTIAADSGNPSGYNGNNIASLTTSLPLEATEADGVATVSFDMTTLQDA